MIVGETLIKFLKPKGFNHGFDQALRIINFVIFNKTILVNYIYTNSAVVQLNIVLLTICYFHYI